MTIPERLIEAVKARAESEGVWTPNRMPKGTVLQRQGDPSTHVFVMTQGLVKLSYLAASGDEWVKSFIADRGIFGASPEHGQAPARYSATCLEPSIIVSLSPPWLANTIGRDAAVASLAGEFNLWLYNRKQAREEALLCLGVEDRYREFLRTEPDLARRLPQGDIARYLRVTPIAFSRIKRRMSG